MDPGQTATTFVGRAAEIELVGRLLQKTRLLTIMGTAGSGKTRLAYEAAHRLRARYPGGVFVCELASLSDPDRLPATIAALFGAGDDAGARLADFVSQQIGDKDGLLLLDNCEHLRSAVAALTPQLLLGAPHMSILATSRERLRVADETAWLIPPLSVPDETTNVETSEAAALLIERIRARDPLYTPSATAWPALAEICRRLDGLPLAIELAASRLVLVNPTEFLKMLDDALGSLRGGEGPPRQETIERALDWSYELLDEEDRESFRRLSVFARSFNVSAAAEVLGTTQSEAIDRLAALRDRSLLITDGLNERASIRMLEPVRQYAMARLQRDSVEAAPRRRHARWVLAAIEDLSQRLFRPGQLETIRAFRELVPDLRLGFRWSLDNEPTWAASIGALTGYLWDAAGLLVEGNLTLLAALESNPSPKELAQIYTLLALLADRRGDKRGVLYGELGVKHARSAGTERELAHALFHYGHAIRDVDEERSTAAFEEAADIALRTGDRLLAAWVAAIKPLGRVAQGDYVAARKSHEDNIPVALELGDIHSATVAFGNLGAICMMQGDNRAARQAMREGLGLLAQNENWALCTRMLMQAAILAARDGRFHESAQLTGAYFRLCELFDWRRLPIDPAMKIAKQRLTSAEYEAALAKGAGLQIADMFAMARREAEQVVPADYGNLTARELEVAKLVARGLSNKQVAARIRRSERTVESHVQHILTKLKMSTRTEIGAWAERQGLLT